jgi:serine/threonine protein kinase
MSSTDTIAEEPRRWFYYQNPKEIGPYQIVRCLGSGGMSKVYLARHRDTGLEVALKVLRPDLISRTNAVQRFETEFRAAHKVRHPHVVRAHDLAVDENLVYLVLEYVDGPSLAQLLREKTCFSEEQAVRWIVQVAEGLELAHQNQVVHRDIKPGNILIAPNGDAKLSDMGLAKDLLAKKELTQSGASLGTLLYMAPELYENARRADPRSDLYSLGVTLYQIVTGRFPFSGGQLTVLKNKLTNRFLQPREIVAEVSPRVNDVICHLLNALPEKRQASCREVIDALLPRLRADTETIEVDPPTIADEGNRREEDRIVTSIESTCSMVLGPRDKTWKGTVLDVSSGGANLLVERRFEVGSLVNVVVILDEEKSDTTAFILRVQWVRQENDSQWRLGGKFHRRMQPADLERLLSVAAATVVIQES